MQFEMNLGSWGKGISCYRSHVCFSDFVIFIYIVTAVIHAGYFFSGSFCSAGYFILNVCFAGSFFVAFGLLLPHFAFLIMAHPQSRGLRKCYVFYYV